MNSPIVSIVVGVGRNREIGKKNSLLWRIPEDMKRFKDLTIGHTVIMGRKTYESIPENFRPLPNRTNIVITRDETYDPGNDVIVAHSFEEALTKAKEREREEIFNIGGGEIYAKGLPHTDRLYLTYVDKDFSEADTFFPDYSDFTVELNREEHLNVNPPFTFLVLERKRHEINHAN